VASEPIAGSVRAIGGGQMNHRWALGSAFELHERLGKARVQNRIHDLNRQLKEGLRKIKGVQLYTPMSEALSSGIVCLTSRALPAQTVDDKLFDRGIVASRTPYKAFVRQVVSHLGGGL
jgi:isopenicillin-N epimerase